MKKIILYGVQSLNKLLALIDFKLLSFAPIHNEYISAKETIEAAKKNKQTVTDYVQAMWQEQGVSQQVIHSFRDFGALNSSTKRVCEIGTGTGMFAEAIIKSHEISQYESYEIDQDWSAWLSQTYNIVSHPATGDSLNQTPSNSIDLVHANGVFVYIPFLVTCKYFFEIIRITKQHGFAVFDIMTEDCFDEDILKSWLMSPHTYPCVFPEEYVKAFFLKYGFSYLGQFYRNFGEGKSVYLVFQKK